MILKFLKLPELRDIEDLNDPSVTLLHARIIYKKRFLRELYEEFYGEYQKIMNERRGGVFIELGSGGGFSKKIVPSIVTSDIAFSRSLDLCFSAERIPFRDSSIDGFLMINVFHHIKNPLCALNEFNRCLKPCGRIWMVEPANTSWGRFVYQNFHHENFDPCADWRIEGEGRLSDANGALPWIIFCRDRSRFESQCKSLKVLRMNCHTPLRYLVSGGLSFRQFMPSFMYPVVKWFEICLAPFQRWLGMFLSIEIQKIDNR